MSGQPSNINKTNARYRILVAPLDWGLGHATRCIPLIRHLERTGAELFLAGEGTVAGLLSAEFPGMTILPLTGYRVRYSRDPQQFSLALFRQLPRILLTIRHEHRWLQQLHQALQFDGIISDNRYGLYLPGIPSVIITHQLQIETGKKLLNRLAAMVNNRLLKCFSACWVPDEAGENNLAGKLSRTDRPLGCPVHYLGPLTRLSKEGAKSTCPLLVLISGPEPQRSLFEKELVEWLTTQSVEAVVVLGKPGSSDPLPLVKGIRFFHHLPAASLNEYMNGAGLILARCGYSTVMDLAILQKKAVLIPTPGQPEQEYLANHLHHRNIFAYITQDTLHRYQWSDLKMMAEKTVYWNGQTSADQVIDHWLSGL